MQEPGKRNARVRFISQEKNKEQTQKCKENILLKTCFCYLQLQHVGMQITQGNLPREHLSTQDMLVPEHISTQDTLVRKQ